MDKNKEIGGFFELELSNNGEYHQNAIKLNNGRNCLLYILKAKNYKKVYLPYYICNSVIQILKKSNIIYEFYSINQDFKPNFNKSLQNDESLLYVNYFGINIENVKLLLNTYKNVIIDNTQAFFQRPIKNEDTFYSARKFFGVSDGGYLYTDKKLEESIDLDESYKRFQHMLKRIDNDTAKDSYSIFKENEKILGNEDIKFMSNLTKRVLASINYDNIKKIRNDNFMFLHENLCKYNEIYIKNQKLDAPMVYPFLINKNGLREFLIKKNIYIATYWKEVLNRVSRGYFEYKLVKNLIPIPIDQRYNIDDMKIIIKNIDYFICGGLR
ncbi:hypothetical protein [Clostridium hydrogenum]|uniref:hypothetical protein n=1 Tax=Clostridium hydrogenum TaxID=2855764 RepID=UPI001F37048E|nr:hypothetical protein [Clostridium hydrogenum]